MTLCLIGLWTALAIWFFKLSGGGNGKPKKQVLRPPGPWRLPIIGSLHHVVSALPHRTITELCRKHGPMMYLRLGEVPTVVVSSAEAVEEMVKANDVAFANRRTTGMQDIAGNGGKGIIFTPYGDHWRDMRRLCIVELLSAKQVRRMESIRAQEMGTLLRYITVAASNGAAINVSQKVAALSNDLVTRAVFGGKFSKQEDYLREADTMMDLLGGFSLVDLFPSSRLVRWFSNEERRIKNCVDVMVGIITDILVDRKATRAASKDDASSTDDDEDLLDVLLRLQEEDSLTSPLTTEIISTFLFDIFGAASETTGTALEWAMSELVTHPKAMAKAQSEVREVLGPNRGIVANSDLAELPYLRLIIKEVLRLHPPPLLPRKTREDCKIMGYDMLKGTNVYINVFGISRDPKYWNNPEDFNPDRFENNNKDFNGTSFEFTPFGGGRRRCPGITFASSILEITLANFLYHYDWILPNGASPDSLDMDEKFGFTVRKRSELELIAIPHEYSKAMQI
jgi:cytochrome P450